MSSTNRYQKIRKCVAYALMLAFGTANLFATAFMFYPEVLHQHDSGYVKFMQRSQGETWICIDPYRTWRETLDVYGPDRVNCYEHSPVLYLGSGFEWIEIRDYVEITHFGGYIVTLNGNRVTSNGGVYA